MITGAQIRAARALLDWTAQDLAEKTAMMPNTITNFEGGKRRTEAETIEKMVKALTEGGIKFTEMGVELRTPVYGFEGPTWYVDLLGDMLGSGAKEIIIQNVDDRKSAPHVAKMLANLRSQGITFRMTAEEGNTHLSMPVSFYRWVPKAYFKNWIVAVYGDRVAFSINNELGCRVFCDQGLADALKNQFNLVWDMLKPLTIESTADERIE